MHFKVSLLVAALYVFYAHGSPIESVDIEDSFFEKDGRITNGYTALPNQFPYQVLLLLSANPDSGNFWCGGSIIDKEWILTAAHCIRKMYRATIYFNTIDRRRPGLLVNVTGDNFRVHEFFNPSYFTNDIALIKIPSIQFSNGIAPSKLPSFGNANDVYVGKEIIVSGWGRTTDAVKDSAYILQYVDLKVMSNHLCSNYFSNLLVNDGQFCVFTPEGKSTCNGDSGGPIVLKDNSVQIGIVSYGSVEGCEKGHPAAFTRITAFLPWIEKQTGLRF